MKVLVVPEAARCLNYGGANIDSNKFSVNQGIHFQKTLLKV